MQVCLLSSDGERFEVNENVATMSVTIRDMIEGESGSAILVECSTVYLDFITPCMLYDYLLRGPWRCEPEYLNADAEDDEEVPLPNVKAKILSKVIEFCSKHASHPQTSTDGKPTAADEELDKWDKEFVKVDQGTLFELILAANYLNIKELLDLTCLTVANMIKGKTPEEIRKTFNIVNDFTPEEEEQVRRENQWAFD